MNEFVRMVVTGVLLTLLNAFVQMLLTGLYGCYHSVTGWSERVCMGCYQSVTGWFVWLLPECY